MRIARSWFIKAATGVAALAFIIASMSASATCYFVAYQPDVPEALG